MTSFAGCSRRFAEYCNSGDIGGIASLYEDGAAFVPEPGTVLTDAAGLRPALQGFIGTGGTLTILSSTAAISGELSLTHSRWRLDVPGADPMEHTSAEVLRRQSDGTWKYVVDNPFGGDVLA